MSYLFFRLPAFSCACASLFFSAARSAVWVWVLLSREWQTVMVNSSVVPFLHDSYVGEAKWRIHQITLHGCDTTSEPPSLSEER